MAYLLDQNLEQFCTPRQWEILTALAEHGSERRAAAALGCHYALISKAKAAVIKKAAQSGYAPEHGWQHPVPDGYKIKGVSTLRDMRTGDAVMQWEKTVADEERRLELVREAVEAWCESAPRAQRRDKKNKDTSKDLMVVIPFGDPHFGMYSWSEETGNDFDTDIAKRDLCAAVDYLVSQSPPSERCVIANLGDFFHADNLEGMTSRSGNILDMDTRLPRVIRIGVAAIRQAIETALSRHNTVEIINAIGNHDDLLSMAMSIMLANVYEKEDRVVVHEAPTRRHYVEHGKVMIGVTHGDRTKDRDLPGIMAAERPEEWGRTRHRYFYRGHLHHTERNEFHGCVVEQFRTLAPADAWHHAGGYMAGRDMNLIVHHREYGEVSRTICSIDMLRQT